METKLTDKELFCKYIEEYKTELKNSYSNCLDYVKDDKNYITLKEIGFEYSFKVANALFELGYASWSFIYFPQKQGQYADLCSLIDDNSNLTEIQKDIYIDFLRKELLERVD